MAEAKEIRLIDVQAAFIVVGAGIALGTIVLFTEKLVKHLVDRFCVKKDQDPCKHIGTVPTMEMELDSIDLNGINNGVYTIDENGVNTHINNGVLSKNNPQHSSDGYG